MELDFSHIKFCGRKHELKQLHQAFRAIQGSGPRGHVRGGGDSINSSFDGSVSSLQRTTSPIPGSTTLQRTISPIPGTGTSTSTSTSPGTSPLSPQQQPPQPPQRSPSLTRNEHRIVFIEGEGGTGKTMLAEHFLEQVEKQKSSASSSSHRYTESWGGGGNSSNLNDASSVTLTHHNYSSTVPSPPPSLPSSPKQNLQKVISTPSPPPAGFGKENETKESSSSSSPLLLKKEASISTLLNTLPTTTTTTTNTTKNKNNIFLVGRGKFEEGKSVPFAAISELLESLLDDLLRKDPEWSSTLDKEIKLEIGRIASVAPKIRQVFNIDDDNYDENDNDNDNQDDDDQDVDDENNDKDGNGKKKKGNNNNNKKKDRRRIMIDKDEHQNDSSPLSSNDEEDDDDDDPSRSPPMSPIKDPTRKCSSATARSSYATNKSSVDVMGPYDVDDFNTDDSDDGEIYFSGDDDTGGGEGEGGGVEGGGGGGGGGGKTSQSTKSLMDDASFEMYDVDEHEEDSDYAEDSTDGGVVDDDDSVVNDNTAGGRPGSKSSRRRSRGLDLRRTLQRISSAKSFGGLGGKSISARSRNGRSEVSIEGGGSAVSQVTAASRTASYEPSSNTKASSMTRPNIGKRRFSSVVKKLWKPAEAPSSFTPSTPTTKTASASASATPTNHDNNNNNKTIRMFGEHASSNSFTTSSVTKKSKPDSMQSHSHHGNGLSLGGFGSLISTGSGNHGGGLPFAMARRNVSNASSLYLPEHEIGGGKVRGSGGEGGQWSFERVRVALRTFFRHLCRQFTVILLLDDLQWTDEMSIKLLEPLLTDQQADHLLFLGTHRPMRPSSPAAKLREKLLWSSSSTSLSSRPSSMKVVSLELGDWTCEEVCELISKLLHRDQEDVWKLATVVHQKTGGTIFFVIQYLRLLYQRKLLTYSLKKYCWEYSMSRIAYETDLCDNVSQFMGDKIGELPQRMQIPIITAAFLGFSRFDSKILWRIIQVAPVSPATTRKKDIKPSWRSGLKEIHVQSSDHALLQSGKDEKASLGNDTGNDNGGENNHNSDNAEEEQDIDWKIKSLEDLEEILEFAVKEGLINKMPYHKRWYKFSHDRVREGALALVPTGVEERKQHLQIGRELRDIRMEMAFEERNSLMHQGLIGGGAGPYARLSGQEVQRLLLLSVRHLNQGSTSITEPSEKVQLARMNLEAAEVVLQQSAFGPALEFLQSGLVLLDRRRKWDDHYELTLKITVKLSHVLFCNGEHDDNWAVIDDVLRNSKCLADKLSVCRTLIVALVAEGRFSEAVETNLDVLDELGVPLPRNVKAIHLVTSYMRTRQKLRHKTDDDLLQFQPGADRWALHQCDFLILLMETCMLGGQVEIQILATMQALWLVLDRGIEEMASMAMAGAGYIYGLRGRNDKSYRFGKLAAKIASQGKYPSLDSRAMSYAYQYLIPWREPYHKCLDPLMSAYKMALDRGDIEQLFLPIMSYSVIYLHCGLRLAPLKSDMLRFLEILEDFGQTEPLLLYRGTVEMVLNLMGPEPRGNSTKKKSMVRIGSKRLSACGYLLTVPQNASARAFQYYYRQQMILACYFDEFDFADEMSSKLSSPLADGPVAWLPPRFFFQGLVYFSLAKKTTSKHKRRGYLKRGTKFYEKLQKIADAGNVNCNHLVSILRAEIVSLNHPGNTRRVQDEYDNAISRSGRLGFLNDQALANQRAGEYVLKRGDKDWASTYLTRSRDLYVEWGAAAKARQLEVKYVELLDQGATESKKHRRQGTGFKARPRLDDARASGNRAHVSMIAFQV